MELPRDALRQQCAMENLPQHKDKSVMVRRVMEKESAFNDRGLPF